MPEDDMNREIPHYSGPRPTPYNILLVVVDDLRADHLPAYGYERLTSPQLSDRLESGIVFENCHSPVGWTLPACASIITGHLPDQHGLVDHNYKFRKPKLCHYLGEDYFRIGITNNGNVVTDSIAPEYLEKLGMERRPAKWRFFNWDDGFDRYEWIARDDHERPFDVAREFLDGRPSSADGKPFFMFLHSNLVHDYHMDREYYLEVGDWIDGEVHPALRRVPDGPEIWREPPPGVDPGTVKRHLIAKYDSGIRATDRRIETILRRIDFDTTIVVLVSDHGEGFEPEMGRVHHCGRLNGDLTHVPLLLWLPPLLRKRYEPPAREDRFCSTIDIVPSLLTLLGDEVTGFPGRFLFELPTHRTIEGCDRGYLYWNDDCVRESYDDREIDIRSELTYPLKRITIRRDGAEKEYVYNLAYDPVEHQNLLNPGSKPESEVEPITFVVAVNDGDELLHNLRASPVAQSSRHEWILVENNGNSRYSSISRLYQDSLELAGNDLVFFLHQDVYLPHGWEARIALALAELEKRDSRWGVLGSAGVLHPMAGSEKELRGHWCDPHGYWRIGPLPHEVQALDEQWLGVRKSSGVHFDPDLPGFHCYGIDLCLTALELSRKSYAIDAFVWHKYKDSYGRLISQREDSPKIQRRWSEEFMAAFEPAAAFVETKWKKYLPFQTTSWTWDAV